MSQAVLMEYDAGVVKEKVIHHVPDGVRDPLRAKPKRPPRTPEDQLAFAHRQSQLAFIRLFNTNFSFLSWYFTGTFCDEFLPATYAEAKRLGRNFLRRLATACPGCRAVLVIGRGKWTGRLHVHCVIDGASRAVILEKWQYGEVSRLEHLRRHNYYDGVDHGQDFTGLACYLHNHWTPEQGGNRWLRTGKLAPFDKEKGKLPKLLYSLARPPRPPKGYMLVEAKETRGGLYFKYVRIPAKEPGVPFIYKGGGRKSETQHGSPASP